LILVKLILDFHLVSALDEDEFPKISGGTMFKKLAIATLVLFCLSMAACRNDSKATGFITEFEAFTNELAKKVDANPTSAGVEDAQKFLDSKKADLNAKWKAVKDSGVSADAYKNAEESMKRNVSTIQGLVTKHTGAIGKDPQMGPKLQKLLQDYLAIIS